MGEVLTLLDVLPEDAEYACCGGESSGSSDDDEEAEAEAAVAGV